LRNIYLKIKNGLAFLKKRLVGKLCNCPPDYTIKDLSAPRKKRKTKKKTTKRQR